MEAFTGYPWDNYGIITGCPGSEAMINKRRWNTLAIVFETDLKTGEAIVNLEGFLHHDSKRLPELHNFVFSFV